MVEGYKMTDQNWKNDEKRNDTEIQRDTDLSIKDRIGLSILTIFVFVGSLLIFQLISYIFNIDLLAPFPGLNFIITPICALITLIAMYILNKSNHLEKILNSLNNLINWLEKYPIIHRILRFIYKHPIISMFFVGIIWAVIKNLVVMYFT
jgi:hypothetical protein